MVHVWVAGKTVLSPSYTRAISERLRDKELIYKALYILSCLLFILLMQILRVNNFSARLRRIFNKTARIQWLRYSQNQNHRIILCMRCLMFPSWFLL